MDKLELFDGGFPLTINTIKFLQDTYTNAIKGLTSIVGETYILKGVQKTGNTVTEGAIVYKNEVLPFKTGLYNSKVVIRETVEQVEYNIDANKDGILDKKPAYTTRFAECSSDSVGVNNAVVSFDFSELKNLNIVKSLTPVGGIIMWSGRIADIPTGWHLCDGNNGTPDLCDKFVVGAGKTYNIKSQGGQERVTLSSAEMPSHTHTGRTTRDGGHSHFYGVDWKRQGNYRLMSHGDNNKTPIKNIPTTQAGDHHHSLNISNSGGGQSHENRPPFYALAYIMFKG